MTEDNFSTPDFMKNSIDFKKQVLIYFYELIDGIKNGKFEDISIGEKTIVKLLTNFGTIDGEVVIFSEDTHEKMTSNQDYAGILYEGMIKALDSNLAKHELKVGSENLIVVNQTGRLVLSNAVVTPYANPQTKFNFAKLLVFTDQIVGVTFGEESHS